MLNRAMINTDFDSGSLSAMATIAHRMTDSGGFEVEAVDATGRLVRRCEVMVREGAGARASIDLLAQDNAARCCEQDQLTVGPNGMLAFHAVEAKRGMVVRLKRAGARSPAWDSQMLEPGDIYACMPLRPGRYGAYDQEDAQRPHMHFRVRYPDPRLVAQGLKLQSGTVHMRNGVEIDPGQAIMFAIQKAGRVRVRLEEPDDGPPELAAWREARSREVLDDALKRWTRKRYSPAAD
jgi:hypothetical protein